MNDPAELRRRLREDSYLFFPKFLARDVVAPIGDAISGILQRQGWLSPSPTGLLAVGTHLPGQPDYWPVYEEVQRLESMHALAHHDTVVELMREVMSSPEVIVHPRKLVRIAFPGERDSETTIASHQDFPYQRGGVDGITAWVPLMDVSDVLGGVEVLVGSASAGIRPVRGGLPPYRCAVVEDATGGTWASAHYEVGDVLLMHSLTVHGARPNLSDTIRLSADFRYRGTTEVLSVDQSLPAWYPDVPGWDELTRGWSSSRWAELPVGVVPMPCDLVDGMLDVPASALVGSPAGRVDLR